MWDFLSKLAGALPPWFLMALIVFLLAAAAWAVPRLRRDKNGRWYIYSRSYEHQKNRIKEQTKLFETQAKNFEEIRGDIAEIKRNDYKQSFYIPGMPESEKMFCGLKYIAHGGNGDAAADVTAFAGKFPALYDGIVRARPDLKLKKD